MNAPKNPIKTAAILSACLFALISLAAFSSEIDSKAEFILFGIVYSLFLSYFAVGAELLAKRWRRLLRYIILFVLIVGLGIISLMFCVLAMGEDGRWFWDHFNFIYHTYSVLCYPVATIAICLPVLGWIGHFKAKNNSDPTEQS